LLQISRLAKRYQGADHDALSDIDLECPEGTFITLLGASGCGKSTLLRCVAGLEDPQSGRIEIAKQPVYDSRTRLSMPINRRHLGMVFQSYAIWPHMSVGGNVAYPLKVQGVRGEEQRRRVEETLRLVGLDGLADRPATGLSGGQQQRVAMARAIVCRPKLLLLDEPMSNLDAPLRRQLGQQLRDLQQSLGLTVLYVTHDRDEALTMSDRIVVMRAGRVADAGSPTELYARPSTAAGALAVGEANFLPVRPEQPAPTAELLCDLFEPPLRCAKSAETDVIMVRPERLTLTPKEGWPSAQAEVVSAIFRGMITEVSLRLVDGTRLLLRSTEPALPEPGTQIRVFAEPEYIRAVAPSDPQGPSEPESSSPVQRAIRTPESSTFQPKQQEVFS